MRTGKSARRFLVAARIAEGARLDLAGNLMLSQRSRLLSSQHVYEPVDIFRRRGPRKRWRTG